MAKIKTRAAVAQVKSMTLRIPDPYVLDVIDNAARISSQTRTGFLILAAQEKAEQIIKSKSAIRAEIENMLISPKAYERVMDRIANPKKPVAKLVDAMSRYTNWSKNNASYID
jgi:uncharacterized protein (DUF1778 family)